MPSVAVAVTYQQRKLPFLKKPRRTVFISEPFYPDDTLSPKEAQHKLQNEVETFLKDKLETCSTYKYFDYRKADETENA